MRKALLWTLIGGHVYYGLEGLWRIPTNGGWANISMLFVGGLCFYLVGSINQIPAFFNLSMRWQAFIGTLIVLLVELISGCVINLWLEMNVWDYSDMPFNIAGQICLPYGVLWFMLMPFAIWLEDRLTLMVYVWIVHNGGIAERPKWDYTLRQAYRELFLRVKNNC